MISRLVQAKPLQMVTGMTLKSMVAPDSRVFPIPDDIYPTPLAAEARPAHLPHSYSGRTRVCKQCGNQPKTG